MDDEVAKLARRVAARIGRVQASMEKLQQRLPSTGNLLVSSVGGEVVVTVDHHGRLMRLELAPESTARLTCEALECLINATIRRAVDAAIETDRSLLAG